MKLEPFLGLRCSKAHPKALHPPGCSGDDSALGRPPQFLLWLVLGALWCVGLGAAGFGGSRGCVGSAPPVLYLCCFIPLPEFVHSFWGTREERGHPRGARHGEGSSHGAALGWGFQAAAPTLLPPAL